MDNHQIIVGIGASAGGLEAITEFFDNMPSDTDMAFVIVQHLSPDHESMMDELLAKHTQMPIKIVKSDMTVRPNHIYLMDKNNNVLIENYILKPVDRSKSPKPNMPIDDFFHSLGTDCKKCIGIILSGSGTDGSRGLRTLKEADGIIFVQSPQTARFDGMPQQAIDTGLVDKILPIDEIVREVIKISHTILDGKRKSIFHGDDKMDEQVNEILQTLYEKCGTNFLHYRRTTILRRLEKRMFLNHVYTPKQYLKLVHENPDELVFLMKDFLIGVTRFFRDPDAFDIIRQTVIPNLIASKPSDDVLRIWVAGCSTGEEAYTLAILLDDYLSENGLRRDFKIFASDIDAQAIRHASAGIFAPHISEDIKPEFLKDYFEKLPDGRYKVVKNIRDCIIFTVHNVLNDPPFINVDLIACRNLLIYLNPDVQQRLLYSFQFALHYLGYLFLGPSETLGKLKGPFEEVSERWSVFRNKMKGKVNPLLLQRQHFHRNSHPPQTLELYTDRKQVPMLQRGPNDIFYQALLDRYVPLCIIVDTELNLLHGQGELELLLQFPNSPSKFNLENMVSMEELLKLKNGIRRVEESGQPNVFKGVEFQKKNRLLLVDIQFEPMLLHLREKPLFLIEFKIKGEADKKGGKAIVVKDKDNLFEEQLRIMDLELRRVKEERNHLVARLETLNEELQSSNEELIASNEELQSINEELQSVNEKLYTVNDELQTKVSELTVSNSDLDNLLRSTQIGTIFVDKELKIRKFTPSLAQQFQLVSTDIGRPITSFTTLVEGVDFQKEMNQVLWQNKSFEKEVMVKGGHPYLMRLLPYTMEDKVVGVVATFIDTTEIKKAESQVNSLAQQFQAIFNSTENIISILSPEGILLNLNNAPDGYEKVDIIGSNFFTEVIPPEAQATAKKAFEECIKKKKVVNYSLSAEMPNGRTRFYHNSMIPVFESGKIIRVLCSSKDETQFREIEKDVHLQASIFNIVFQHAREHILIISKEGIVLDVNYTEAGFKKSDLIGKPLVESNPPGQKELVKANLEKILNGGHYAMYDTEFDAPNGKHYWYQNILSPVMKDGSLECIVLISRDITDSKLIEISLKENNEILEERVSQRSKELEDKNKELENMNSFMDNFVHGAAHDLRSPLMNIKGFVELLPQVKDEAELKSIVEELGNATERMNLILSGLVELIEFQRTEGPKPKRIKLKPLVDRTLKSLQQDLEKTGGKVEINIPENLTLVYIEAFLQSVVHNLLHNAIKYYSYERPLHIKIEAEEVDDFVRLSVHDNGIGMNLNKYGHFLFTPFRRLTVERDGSGIGLSIINNAVERNGGRIEVESKLDKGTIFHVFLKPYTLNV